MPDAQGVVEFSQKGTIPIPGPKLTFELCAPRPARVPDGLTFILRKLPSRTDLSDDLLGLKIGPSVDMQDDTDDVQVIFRSSSGDLALIRYEKPKGSSIFLFLNVSQL